MHRMRAAMGEPNQTLDAARRDAGLSHGELWQRYFAVGGMRTSFELEAMATNLDHDLIAVALNERFSELGANHSIPYSHDDEAE